MLKFLYTYGDNDDFGRRVDSIKKSFFRIQGVMKNVNIC